MKKITIVLAALVMMLAVQTATAHPHGKKQVHKQYNQHKRIQHGVRSGTLTRPEAKMLRGQQAKVRHYKQMAMADGRITPRERQLINRTQMNASRNIYRQKHDGQVRRW